MKAEELRREEIESLIDDMTDKYGDVEIEGKTIALPPTEFEDHFGYTEAGYNGGGYAWVIRDPDTATSLSDSTRESDDGRRRALMVYPRTDDAWGLPGGGREGDETFEEAAVREVREETGIECSIEDLWLLRKHIWESEDPDDDRRTYSLHAFFDASYTGRHISIQPSEMDGAAWFATPPERMMPANELRAEFWSP